MKIIASSHDHKVWDIHGGIHPAENKAQSLTSAIMQAPIPAELTYPLAQHIGAPAQAIVSVGQQVLKGEMIAKANGFVSVPIHASTSGTIIAIEDRPIAHSSGMLAPCIVLQADGLDTWIEHQGLEDYTQVDKAELIAMIREAGIAGMGGAGFPSAVKLNTRPEQIIETLIINGTECEPYITADDILMRERAEQVIAGVEILRYIVKPSKEVLIGVEDNKPEAIAALRKAAGDSGIKVVSFPTKYPSGGEKQLIQILTGKEVPAGGLPASIGVVCQNIGSTVAIYKAISLGEPLISRITTVTGNAVARQQNYEVRLGSPMRTLLDASAYDAAKNSRLIMGGPMMGFTLQSQDLPIVKTTNCILAPSFDEMPNPPPQQACIRCGLCAEACPVSLLPQQMYWFSRSKNNEELQKQNLFDCIECGACSFVCPSNIPLVQYYRASKADIRRAEADLKKADYSKERFEARQHRLEQAEIEKEAKRRERQEKAAAAAAAKAAAPEVAENPVTSAPVTAISDDPVQAAIDRAKAKATGAAVDPVEDAKAKLAALEKRLIKAEEKLASAREMNDENLAAFEGSVEKLQAKIAEAKASMPAPSNTAAASDDPVQAAIERAKAKRSGGGETQDPVEKLQADVASLHKRIAASEEKLQAANAEGSDKAAAFEASVTKLKEKLLKAESELAQLQTPVVAAAVEPAVAPSDDPVQAAIERAKAKRAGTAEAVDPKSKLSADIASLNKRIAKAEEKLQAATEQGLDSATAIASSLPLLHEKLSQAQQALKELG